MPVRCTACIVMHGIAMQKSMLEMSNRAMANGAQKQTVAVVDIGEGFGLLGFEVRPVPAEKDGKEQLHAVLFAIGGRVSDLVPLKPVAVPLCPLGGVDLEVLRAQIASALEPVS